MLRVHPDGRVYIDGFQATVAELQRLLPEFMPLPGASHEYTGTRHVIRDGAQHAGAVPWPAAQLVIDDPQHFVDAIQALREAGAELAEQAARDAEAARRAALPTEERVSEDLATIGLDSSIAVALAIRLSDSWTRQPPALQAIVQGIIDDALAMADGINLD